MLAKDLQNANQYFKDKTSIVYVEKCTKIESFEEYLRHRYRDNCYYYSAYALMGLKPDDTVLRGYLKADGYGWDNRLHHGWVEFKYDGNEFVFDSAIMGVIPKIEWYDEFYPEVDFRKTQKEILDEYLNEKNAVEIQEGFWQFKYFAMNGNVNEKSYNEVVSYDKNNGHIPSALMLSRIVLSKYDSTIRRFIAYSESSY